MTSFLIGRVVEPEIREIKVKATGQLRQVCVLGVLSGRTCNQFDIFDGTDVFEKASSLEDGDLVLCIVGVSVDNKGALRCYLNSIGECPEGLREELMSLVRK